MNKHLRFWNYRMGFLVTLLAFAVLLLVTACSSESTRNEPVTTTPSTGKPSTAPPASEVEKRDTALVRAVNAIPDQATDLFAGDKKTFNDISYKTITPYQELSKERYTFRVRPAGEENAKPLAENSEGLSSGKHYTVIAMPGKEGKEPVLHVVNDNLTPPTSGKAKIRLVNASADAGELDVYTTMVKKNKLFSRVNPQSETFYTEVDPMSTALEVCPKGQKNPILTVENANFEAGKVYTVFIVGNMKGAHKLEAIMVEDQLVGETGMKGTEKGTENKTRGPENKTENKKY